MDSATDQPFSRLIQTDRYSFVGAFSYQFLGAIGVPNSLPPAANRQVYASYRHRER